MLEAGTLDTGNIRKGWAKGTFGLLYDVHKWDGKQWRFEATLFAPPKTPKDELERLAEARLAELDAEYGCTAHQVFDF